MHKPYLFCVGGMVSDWCIGFKRGMVLDNFFVPEVSATLVIKIFGGAYA